VQFNSSRLTAPAWAVVEIPDTPKPGKPCLNRCRDTGEFLFPQHFGPAGTSVIPTETKAFDDALSGRSAALVSRTNAVWFYRSGYAVPVSQERMLIVSRPVWLQQKEIKCDHAWSVLQQCRRDGLLYGGLFSGPPEQCYAMNGALSDCGAGGALRRVLASRRVPRCWLDREPDTNQDDSPAKPAQWRFVVVQDQV